MPLLVPSQDQSLIDQTIPLTRIMLLQPFVILLLAVPVDGEPLELETVMFAAAVVATVLVGYRTRLFGALSLLPAPYTMVVWVANGIRMRSG